MYAVDQQRHSETLAQIIYENLQCKSYFDDSELDSVKKHRYFKDMLKEIVDYCKNANIDIRSL